MYIARYVCEGYCEHTAVRAL